ncbi:MAG: hypothetical protein ACE5HB_02775 [Terriglobia bacterium]
MGDLQAPAIAQTEAEATVVSAAQAGERRRTAWLAAGAGVIGGLCCLTPIVLVLLGLATASAAADLGNVLYGEYRWAFRLTGLGFLAGALVLYFRSRGVCTLEQAKRERNRILNAALLALVTATGVYFFWTYVVLHYWGIAAGLPWAQYDESWALPASAVAFAAFFLLYRRLR